MKSLLRGLLVFLILGSILHAAEQQGVTSQTLVKSTRSWDGKKLPAYPKGQPEISILRIVIPPNSRLPMHKHPFINAGVLVKGELTVKTESGKVLRMKAGDPIVELVEKWHYGANEGKAPAEIIVFYAAVEGKPVTVKK